MDFFTSFADLAIDAAPFGGEVAAIGTDTVLSSSVDAATSFAEDSLFNSTLDFALDSLDAGNSIFNQIGMNLAQTGLKLGTDLAGQAIVGAIRGNDNKAGAVQTVLTQPAKAGTTVNTPGKAYTNPTNLASTESQASSSGLNNSYLIAGGLGLLALMLILKK